MGLLRRVVCSVLAELRAGVEGAAVFVWDYGVWEGGLEWRFGENRGGVGGGGYWLENL